MRHATRNHIPSLRRQAFTLIEMIVIATVFITAVVLIIWVIVPWGNHRAYRVNCADHQRDIGRALAIYAENSDGFLPMQHAPGTQDLQVLEEENSRYNFRKYGCPASPRMQHKGEGLPNAGNMDFVYIGSGLRQYEYGPEFLRLTFDVSGNHPNNAWMNVLFHDGHTQGAKPDGTQGWNTMASLATDPTGAAAKVAAEMAAQAAQGAPAEAPVTPTMEPAPTVEAAPEQ